MVALNDDAFDLAAFVAASCARHGVPIKIADAAARSEVAILLTGRAGKGNASACSPSLPGSDSPYQIDPLGIER